MPRRWASVFVLVCGVCLLSALARGDSTQAALGVEPGVFSVMTMDPPPFPPPPPPDEEIEAGGDDVSPADDSPDEARPGEGRRGKHRGLHGRGQKGERGSRSGMPPILPEHMDAAMKVLEEKLPEVYERLMKAKEQGGKRFENQMRKVMPMVMEYMMLKEHHPELADSVFEEYEIERQLHRLGRLYQKAGSDAAKQKELEGKIRELVERQFELRHKRVEFRLAEFAERLKAQEKRLEEERAKFKEVSAKRDEMIRERIDEVKEGRSTPGTGPGWRGPGEGQHREGVGERGRRGRGGRRGGDRDSEKVEKPEKAEKATPKDQDAEQEGAGE